MITPVLLALVPVALQAPAAVEAEDPVLRFYDVRAALPPAGEGDLALLAFPRLFVDEGQPFGVPEGADGDLLAELVLRCFEQDFEYEGRSLDVRSDGRLLVAAPEGVQARVAALLGELQAGLEGTVELTLDVLRLDDLPRELGAGQVLSEGQVRPLLEQAAREGRRESFVLRAGSGRPALLDVGPRVSVLADYDVEVAEGCYIHDPVRLDLRLGTRLALRVAPGDGGLNLALLMRRSRTVGPIVEEVLNLTGRTSSESRQDSVSERLIVQRPRVAYRSLALSTFLPDDRALVLESRLGDASGGGSEVVLVRRSAGSLRALRALTGLADGAGTTLVDLSAFDPPSTASSLAERCEGLPAALPLATDEDVEVWQVLRAAGHDAEGEELVWRALDATGRDYDSQTSWPWMFLTETGDGPRATATDLAALLAGLAPDPRLVSLSFTLRAGGASGAEVAHVAVPVRTQQASSIVLGVEGLLDGEVDVEIAKYSGVEDPVQQRWFEGLVLEVEPRIDSTGGLVLDLQVLASRQDEAATSFTYDPSTRSALQQRPSTELLLREQLRFPSGGPRSQQALLGDVAGSLALEVRASW